MSEQDQDSSSSSYKTNSKGQVFYIDDLGEWFQKSNDFETIFFSQVPNADFRDTIYQQLRVATGDMASFEYKGNRYFMFINQDDPEKSNISRKKVGTGNNQQAKQPLPQGQTQTQVKSSTGGYQPTKRDRPINESTRLVTLSEQEFKDGYKFQAFEDYAKSANPNIMIIQKPNGEVEYQLVLTKITFKY